MAVKRAISDAVLDRELTQFQKRLKAARAESGLSMAKVFATSGVYSPNISRIENGQTVPSLETLERICNAIGTTVLSMLGGNGRKVSDKKLRRIVARNLRAHMDRLEMTNGDVAYLAGLDATYIHRIANAECNPTVGAIVRISYALDIRPWELVVD